MKARVFLGALALVAASSAQAQVTVFESDNAFDITTLIRNATAGLTVSKITFDSSATHTSDGSYIVMDSVLSTSGPSGGSATFFGGGSLFGFDYTGFGSVKDASFSWDPDSAINSSFGALASDLLGMVVTAETSAGVLTGVFGQMTFGEERGYGTQLTAAIPEPSTYALMGVGLLGMAFVARRRRQT